MSMHEGSRRILHVGISTLVCGILGALLAIALKDIDAMGSVAGLLFLWCCVLAVGGFIVTVIGYILQGFAQP